MPEYNSKLSADQVADHKAHYEELKAKGQTHGFGAGSFPSDTPVFA
jgi:hypothetical protein